MRCYATHLLRQNSTPDVAHGSGNAFACVSKGRITLMYSTYRCVDSERHLPSFRGDDLCDSVFPTFRLNLAHIGHRIAKLLFSGPKGGTFGNAVQSVSFCDFGGSIWLSSPLHSIQVQGFRTSRAQRHRRIVDGDTRCMSS